MKKYTNSLGIINSSKTSDYNREFSKFTPDVKKPTLLLHACCAPCSTACVERLVSNYSVTLYYYNPNIVDKDEYLLRKDTLLQFLDAYNSEHRDEFVVNFIEGPYEPDIYICKAEQFKNEPEGGKRCDICFSMRLTETARKAAELSMDYFTTTMSVSPHKNYDKIRIVGLKLEDDYQSNFLDIDFKKKNGFARSVELSKYYGLYRQNFCGCEYAREAMNK